MDYPLLTTPYKVGKVVLKNRMISAPTFQAWYGNGGEHWPNDRMLSYTAAKARTSGIVTCKGSWSSSFAPLRREGFMDITDVENHGGFAAVADVCHFYGAKASIMLVPDPKLVFGFDASSGVPSFSHGELDEGDGVAATMGKEAPEELLLRVAARYAEEARHAKECGYDGCYIHMAYRMYFVSRFISPLTNHRTDKFGGSLENRLRFPKMVLEEVKKACGEEFLIQASVSAYDNDPQGVSVEDTLAFAKHMEGLIDILQVRGWHVNDTCTSSFETAEFPNYNYIAAMSHGIKDRDIRMKVSFVGGISNIDHAEEILKKGDADLIDLGRAAMADPDWGKKAYEGRGVDVVPCIRCNRCHIPSPNLWSCVCSVNPVSGLEAHVGKLVTTPVGNKKVAVVGGGTAGMEAALVSAGRGYQVTLYEQQAELGGALNYAAVPDFKGSIRRFRDYLVNQVNKQNITVRLNTKATPQGIRDEGYDVVFVAVGAEPAIPPIPGYDQPHVITALEALDDINRVKGDTVVIGGGEIGVETGIYLASAGKNVFVIEMREKLAPECPPEHFRHDLRVAWEAQKTFLFAVESSVSAINADSVTYVDAQGKVQTVKADTVIMATGMTPKIQEATAFAGSASKFEFVGDCLNVGNIQTAMRSAYGRASNV